MADPEAPASSSDTRLVRELADVLIETGLTEIEIERGDLKIRVVKQAAPSTVYAAAPSRRFRRRRLNRPLPRRARRPSREAMRSSRRWSGRSISKPSRASAPFARVGDTVSEGQTILLIEAMKTMNPIVAPRAGKIVEILVGDSQPVEYGEPLAIIA